MGGVCYHEEVGQDAKEYDDESRDKERPAPRFLVTQFPTVSPEGRDNGPQDVPHGGVGVPNTHDETTAENGKRKS